MDTTIESSFCYQYLTNFVGLKRSTIESLVVNDYDSFHSLMAFDLEIDLNQLPNVSMGQKSILREALLKLKKEFKLWIEAKPKEVSPDRQSVLNSTPIPKMKDPFISNDHKFRQFISTAMMDITGEHNSVPSFQANVSSYADKQSVDSGINGTDANVKSRESDSGLNMSPVKRKRRPSIKKIENTETINSENNQNSKQIKSIGKSGKQNKRMKRKLRYTTKSFKRRDQNRSKQSPSQTERKVLIDIDMDNEELFNGATDESAANQSIGDNNRENESIVRKIDFTQKSDDNDFWKLKKPLIIGLIKNKSNQIQLKRYQSMKKMIEFFKVVVIDGTVSPFAVCNLCIASNHYQLFKCGKLLSSGNLKGHLKHRHQSHPSVAAIFQNESKNEDSYLSAEEFDSNETQNDLSQKSGRKSVSPKKSLEELAKTTNSQIIVSKVKINFDEQNNRYLADLTDNESHNSSQVVVHNYDQIFGKSTKIKNKKDFSKPYKCTVEGCPFETSYPFSLDQHQLRSHSKPIQVMPNKSSKSSNSTHKKKVKSFSVLGGMNEYVINYMNSNSFSMADQSVNNRENLSQVNNDHSLSPLLFQSPDSKYSSDCLTNRNNSESILKDTNDQINDNNINGKIVTKIKDWFKN